MRWKVWQRLFLLSVTSLACPGPVDAQILLEETTVDTHTVISGIDHPWEILWGPDDHLWVTERFGRISRIHPENGTRDILLDISSQVAQEGESGMLGLALHPAFPSDDRVYVVYTYYGGGNILERLVIYHYTGGSLQNPEVAIEDIPGNSTHDGSRLHFGPDGKLYMTTGDAQDQSSPQDLQRLSGKVLRINPNGSIPSDNPFPDSYVYSFGHRNAQGLCTGPGDRLYSSEHGPSSDDELNIIAEGRNFGWPNVNGYCDLPSEEDFCNTNNVVEPILAWTPTLAVSDVEYYPSSAIPEFQGALLMATLKEKDLRVIHLSEDGLSVDHTDTYFDGLWDRLRAVCIAPDGSIYVSNSLGNWGNSSTSFTHSIIHIFNPEAHGYLDLHNTPEIRAWPNPFLDRIDIRSSTALSGARYAVVNPAGQRLCTGSEREVEEYLNARAGAGIYLLTAATERGTWQQAVVKSGP